MSENTQDHLIARIAGNEATRDEFALFESEAEGDPRLWESLARTLRDELQLRAALDAAIATNAEADIERAQTLIAGEAPRAQRPWRTWSGWAAAAVLAIALTFSMLIPVGPVDTESSPGEATGRAVPASLTVDEAYETYLDLGEREGRLVMQMPSVMIEARPIDEGGYEVLYLRQVLERETVNGMYELQPDEFGEPVPVPTHPRSLDTLETSM